MNRPAPQDPPASIAGRPGRSGVVQPEGVRWHGRLAARLIWAVTKSIALTLRWQIRDESGVLSPGTPQPLIFAIWHNRLALSLFIHRRYVSRRTGTDRQLAAIVSASRDGGLLARVLELYRVVPVRGSSSRRGAQALREIITAARAGHDIALTTDGPRGPVYQVQPGVVAAAQLTGLPIIPVSYRHGWKKTLKSWDRFQIPLPFSRVEIHFAAPIRVPTDADEPTRERLRQELEATLRAITVDD